MTDRDKPRPIRPHASGGDTWGNLESTQPSLAAALRCERLGNGNYRCRSRKAANEEARRRIENND